MRAPFGRNGRFASHTRLFPGERGTKTMSVDTTNATATAGVDPARARVTGAIKQAANATGTSFEYLLATAKMESDFNPSAGASTSSARGLYQFIEQTWLATVRKRAANSATANMPTPSPRRRPAIMRWSIRPCAARS